MFLHGLCHAVVVTGRIGQQDSSNLGKEAVLNSLRIFMEQSHPEAVHSEAHVVAYGIAG